MIRIICTLVVLCVNCVDVYAESCPFLEGVPSSCDSGAKYRTINGVCNNLDHPEWGKAGIPFIRLLDPAYEGTSKPRTKSSTNSKLPGARDVSRSLHSDTEDPSPVFTFMHMTVGQVLDHDITITATNPGVTCGAMNCGENGECFPIKTDEDDPDFSGCINFVRSFGDTECQDHREQVNKITSFLDAGFVYGDDDDTVAALRDPDPTCGKLTITPHPVHGLKGLLPQNDVSGCFNTNATIKCFLAGDVRVNVQMGLTAIHTILHREHNNIVDKLHKINPHWDGETLYQEARRIVAAAFQQISYGEYLPPIMGPDAMNTYGLTLNQGCDFWNGYDSSVNPGIFNNFATACFRFGHSQIGNFIRFTDAMNQILSDRVLSNEMLRPLSLYIYDNVGSGVDAVNRGQASLAADIVDRHMSKQMTAHLFTPNAPFGVGSDLAARNIQRGRDHGIPSYVEWREYCGLSADLSDIPQADRAKLLDVYDSMADVDLWVGGLAESHISKAMVGPVFACLLGEQFRNLKAGDRFWFENEDKDHGFTKDQLTELRKFSLAHLICENGDDIGEIQPKVMLQPRDQVPKKYSNDNADLMNFLYEDGNNARVPCSQIPGPNFEVWKEKQKGKGKGKGK